MTKQYYLLGCPIRHSRSPMMHNRSFEALGIDARYDLMELTAEQLPDAVARLRSEAAGFNLTAPLKEAMLPLCDELSETAKLCGAVNTVCRQDGRLIGHSTDGGGFLRALAAAGLEVAGKRVTLLGTGGAAKAVLCALAKAGAESVCVFYHRKTSAGKIRLMVEQLQTVIPRCSAISLYALEDQVALQEALLSSALLVNATSVGMSDDASHDTDSRLSPVNPEFLFADLSVADLIYEPEETLLLGDAKAKGCRTLNGLPMLLYQGAESFRLWTGKEMPVALIREHCFPELSAV